MVATLIAAGAQYLATATGMTLAYATFAVNFAVSLIVTRIFADNPETQQDMGVRQQVPPSAVNAIPVVYGDAYMGGTFVDAVLTTDQKTMYYVLAISSISEANATLGTAAGVFNYDTTKMYYGDRLITFDGTDLTKVVSLTDEAGNVDTKISGNLYINLYKSSSAGVITSANGASAPSTVMGGSDIAVGQRWPAANRQMNNLGFAIVKLVYNRDADTTQLQPITFNVSHYPNGASVAKPGDVWLDYITNKSYGGAIGWLPDGTFTASYVDATSATALNVYSDATITYTPAGGGSPVTQARYRINGVLDAGQTVLSNLDRIMSACDSWMTYNAALGQWSVVINKAESTAYAFTDNNIVGDIRVGATDITSSINQVEARFPFKSNRDQASFVNIQTPTGLLYPNEPVNKYSITYDMVNDSVQAQYLANRLLEQAREDLLVSFNTTYYGIQVDAGNVISVTNADYGWNAKLFRVMKVNEASLSDGSLGARLELTEYNAQVYDDFDITQFTPAPNSGLSSPVFFSSLTAPTATGFPSAVVPNVSVQVFIPVTGRVTFVNLFFTTSATPTASDWKLLASANSSNSQPIGNNFNYTFTNNIINTGTYYFAYLVGNEVGQSALSTASSAFVWTPVAGAGAAGPFVDISGLTVFSRSSGGTVTPSTATLTAVTQNVTSPTYAWTITNATPTTGSASTITITPDSGATDVTASLVVNGSNLTSAITRSITMAVVDDGSSGSTGPRNAQVYFFYNAGQSTAPTAPTTSEVAYNFASQTASTTASGWATTFSPSAVSTTSANNKYWAVLVVFQENTYGGSYSETISTVFTWQNLNGLVTFTNLSNSVGSGGTTTTFIDGGAITANSLQVDKITSGTTSSLNGGVFTLGNAGVVLNGFSGVGGFESTTSGRYGLMAFQETPSSNQAAAFGASTYSNGAAAIAAFATYDLNYNSFYTAFSASTNSFAGNGRYNRSIGTVGNIALVPVNSSVLNGADNAGYFAYYGTSATARIAEAFIANTTTVSGYVGRRYDTTGVTLLNEIYLNNGSYAAESTLGSIYSAGGYLPFTGTHDGLIEVTEAPIVGDIVVDYQVEAVLDVSNIVMLYKKSTTANQKGVIGVCIQIFDVPPSDWNEYENTGEVDPITGTPVPDPAPVYNPMYYPIPAGQKVIHINALGEGLINVCGEGGDIEIGDLIVTSSISGKGMKQADDFVRSITVAKSRQAVTFSSPTDVQQIACIYLGG
jgi:hypothetical protein